MTFPISPPSATAGQRLSERILENASAYTRIQASLAGLQHVPTVRTTQTQKLTTLETELSRTIADVRQLDEATRKQREEHAQMRDASARKLAYKLAGRKEKFEEIASKEERCVNCRHMCNSSEFRCWVIETTWMRYIDRLWHVVDKNNRRWI